MAKPFSALPQVLDARVRQINRRVTTIVRRSAEAAGKTAVKTTRVDTGLLRSNWHATLNAPTGAIFPAFSPGNRLGISERSNALGAIAQHKVAIAPYTASKGQTIYIANNVPYGPLINFGTPNISPGNMLELARQSFVLKFNSMKVFKK